MKNLNLVALFVILAAAIGNFLFAQSQGPGGNYYQCFISPGISWSDANQRAKEFSFQGVTGHLATIASGQEDLFLEQYRRQTAINAGYGSSQRQEFLVGGFQLADQLNTAAGWHWVNDEGPIAGNNGGASYANWLGPDEIGYPAEPNDCCQTPGLEDNEENHLGIGLRGFGWNDNDSTPQLVLGFIVEYDTPLPNRPPQITHTQTVTSSLQSQDIAIHFSVDDPDNNLQSVELYYRQSGTVGYQVVGESNNQNKDYILTIPDTVVQIPGVDYYLKATDAENAEGFSGTDILPYHVNVVDKWPVIIIPGIMGSILKEKDNPNNVVWLKISSDPPIDPSADSDFDCWLMQLMLETDGITPHTDGICCRPFRDCIEPAQCPFNQCISGKSLFASAPLHVSIGKIGYTYYEDLANFLEDNGYVRMSNLFFFVYDWRLDIRLVADDLKKVIDQIAAANGGKVNIIAHSMGGLVTRSYFQQNPNDVKVDTVVHLGAPHRGAPKIFAILAGYTSVIEAIGGIIPLPLNNVTSCYISQNFPAIYQLLPRYDFFVGETFATSFERLFNDQNNSYRKPNRDLLSDSIDFYSGLNGLRPNTREYQICGSGQLTLAFLEDLGDKVRYYCRNGDGTVPFESSNDMAGIEYSFVNENHGRLPGNKDVQQQILEIFQNQKSGFKKGNKSDISATPFPIPNYWTYQSSGPIKMKLTDSIGNTNVANFEGNILSTIPNSEHFVIDNGEAGFMALDEQYNIRLKANQTEVFSLSLTAHNSDGNLLNSFGYYNVPITENSQYQMTLTNQNEQTLNLDVDGDGNIDFQITPGNVPAELTDLFARRGDANLDKQHDIADAISILSYLFASGSLSCPATADANSSGETDIADAIFLLSYLFADGEEPVGLVFCP